MGSGFTGSQIIICSARRDSVMVYIPYKKIWIELLIGFNSLIDYLVLNLDTDNCKS